MTAARPHPSVISYPTDLEVVLRRDFDAPAAVVFDVLNNPIHVRKTLAPFDEIVKVCEIDLRVGGNYHFVFVTPDGIECSFRGTYLAVDPPLRTSQTWAFEGWPGVEAIETIELREHDGVTSLTHTLAFADAAGRARMQAVDGLEANYEHVAALVAELVAAGG